jgi:hypothetical protein
MVQETIAHPEQGKYRAVTGEDCTFPNADGVPTEYAPFPEKGTIPVAKQRTGTISGEDDSTYIRGTSTLFTKQIQEGDFIYSSAGDGSLRKVKHIISDTLLILDAPFPTDVTGINLMVCKPQFVQKASYAKSTGTVDAVLNEAPFIVGDVDFGGGSPLAYNASTADAQISFSISK